MTSYPWVKTPEAADPRWVKESEGLVKVSPGGSSFGSTSPQVRAKLAGMAHPITDEDIERDKAGNRGLFMAEFAKILADCDNGDPDDPRWHELRLRTLDRMAKLTRVYEADAPTVKAGPADARILAEQAGRQLVELEASLAETRGPGSQAS